MKEYMVVPFNPQLNEKEVSSGGAQKLAQLLQGEINKVATMGWAFKNFETIAVSVNPCCLAIFGGRSATTVNYGTIIFEKEIGR